MSWKEQVWAEILVKNLRQQSSCWVISHKWYLGVNERMHQGRISWFMVGLNDLTGLFHPQWFCWIHLSIEVHPPWEENDGQHLHLPTAKTTWWFTEGFGPVHEAFPSALGSFQAGEEQSECFIYSLQRCQKIIPSEGAWGFISLHGKLIFDTKENTGFVGGKFY